MDVHLYNKCNDIMTTLINNHRDITERVGSHYGTQYIFFNKTIQLPLPIEFFIFWLLNGCNVKFVILPLGRGYKVTFSQSRDKHLSVVGLKFNDNDIAEQRLNYGNFTIKEIRQILRKLYINTPEYCLNYDKIQLTCKKGYNKLFVNYTDLVPKILLLCEKIPANIPDYIKLIISDEYIRLKLFQQ